MDDRIASHDGRGRRYAPLARWLEGRGHDVTLDPMGAGLVVDGRVWDPMTAAMPATRLLRAGDAAIARQARRVLDASAAIPGLRRRLDAALDGIPGVTVADARTPLGGGWESEVFADVDGTADPAVWALEIAHADPDGEPDALRIRLSGRVAGIDGPLRDAVAAIRRRQRAEALDHIRRIRGHADMMAVPDDGEEA